MAIGSKVKYPELSPEMVAILEKSHGDGENFGYDDIDSYKFKIMDVLIHNQDLLKTLNNKELEKNKTEDNEINGDVYRNVNIFNYLKFPGTNSVVKNFVCFDVDDIEQILHNENLIVKHIKFRTITHGDDCETDWGIARQDLLAAIIKKEFDWSNIFGMHVSKVYDRGRISEDGYYYREFVYETTAPNNLVNKAKNGGVTYGKYKQLR